MQEMLVLRLIHVVGGTLWVGALFFFVVFFEPAMRNAGAEGGRMMMRIASSRYPQVAAVIAILTIITGLRLYMRAAAVSTYWMSTPTGLAYGIGGGAAVLAFLLGFLISRPTARRMASLAAEIQAGGAPPTEDQALTLQLIGRTLTRITRLVFGLLVISAVTMSVARYLG